MGAVWLLDLPDVLAAAGLDVRVWPGWQSRSRSSGGYDAVYGIVVHHTASDTTPDNDAGYMWDSTTGDQPIGALLLDRSGRVTVGAAGATNCAGKGGPWTTSKGTVPVDKGNAYTVSIEAANDGVGEPWPTAQQDAYLVLVAALAADLDLDPVRDVAAHFEWTDRKIDPAGPSRYATGAASWDMDAFRGDVAAPDPTPPSTPAPTPPEGDDMPTAMVIQSNGGANPGAVAVTDLAMTTKRYIHADDATRLMTTGYYGHTVVTLEGDVFDGIPADATVDVIEGGR